MTKLPKGYVKECGNFLTRIIRMASESMELMANQMVRKKRK